MDRESARKTARNVYAKHADCTRLEAERLLRDVPDEQCLELATMPPEEAEAAVKIMSEAAAHKLLSKAAREPSVEARGGLSEKAEKVGKTYRDLADSIEETVDQIDTVIESREGLSEPEPYQRPHTRRPRHE